MRFVLFAPNIHTGGGLILLKELLKAPPEVEKGILWIDERAKGLVSALRRIRSNG